jgi:nucleoside-diphosphate-sugar epimerase
LSRPVCDHHHHHPHYQAIADSWPRSLDDSEARKDWGWQPEVDLDGMCTRMLTRLRQLNQQGVIKL